MKTRTALIIGMVLMVVSCSQARPKIDGTTRILAIGDSVIDGSTLPKHAGRKNRIDGGWVTLIRAKLSAEFGAGNVEIFGEGVSGETLKHFDGRVHETVAEYQPDIIVLSTGSEDINANWMGFVSRLIVGKTFRNIEAFDKQLRKTFSKIGSDSQGTPVFVIGLTVPNSALWTASFWSFAIAMPEQQVVTSLYRTFNQRIALAADEFGFEYIDLSSRWPTDPTASQSYFVDGIGLNSDGYRLVARIVFEAIEASIRSRRQLN